ncbi:hypothetical protein BDY19DRAFT_939299 [Irpex rosettiformis]|uniref:Uncharacterized protein n=1 Tax=Irpex rosettiformis TaxID=378272 RepID=A0ACB8U7E2_9APHY|nr:hypothetical protein BDY19DRAFT_939299 [Irpex rosettiformis]
MITELLSVLQTLMADSNIHSTLSGALTSQTMTTSDPSQQHPQRPSSSDPNVVQQQHQPPINPDGTPVKRRPGRPKGSGKKQLENAEPKVKRPVGRPRKDGLPAGSVGPKKPTRPRKRGPGDFAAGVPPSGILPPFGTAPFGDVAQWQSISAPPMASLRPPPPPNVVFPIDPNLDRDNWVELSRHHPDALLYHLVTALHAPNPLSAAGINVEDAFKAHLTSLTPTNKDANNNNISSLYSILKTFWLPTSPSYFSLTASAGTNRVPSEHRFLYWDPQPLVFNGIACPVCGTPLVNRGHITTGPIKVYDLGKPFFIIGCEYVCRSQTCISAAPGGEGRKFASTDISILRALPAKLKDEFPAKLIQGAGATPDLGSGPDVWCWRGMGVSSALWDMTRAALRSGLQKDVILGLVGAVQNGIPEESWYMHAAAPASVAAPQAISSAGKKPDESGNAVAGPSGVTHDEDGDGMGDEGDESEIEGELNKEKPTDEFQDAWENHSPNRETNANGVQQPTTDQHAPQQQHPTSASIAGPPTGPNDVHPNLPPGIPPEYANSYAHPPAPPSTPSAHPPPHPPPQQGVYMQAYTYPPYAYYQQPPFPVQPPSSMKRTFALVESGADGSSEPMHKRVRHCVKCGSNECKGKGGRAFCTNPCQDCGKLDCKGRNSKRPDRTCADAWP